MSETTRPERPTTCPEGHEISWHGRDGWCEHQTWIWLQSDDDRTGQMYRAYNPVPESILAALRARDARIAELGRERDTEHAAYVSMAEHHEAQTKSFTKRIADLSAFSGVLWETLTRVRSAYQGVGDFEGTADNLAALIPAIDLLLGSPSPGATLTAVLEAAREFLGAITVDRRDGEGFEARKDRKLAERAKAIEKLAIAVSALDEGATDAS